MDYSKNYNLTFSQPFNNGFLNMKKLFAFALLLVILSSCKKRGISPTELTNVAIGPVWKAYEFSKNGTTDAAVIKRNPTFEFRVNSKLYTTLVSPVLSDSMNYQFVSDYNIKVTKPAVSNAPVYNYHIDVIDNTHFNFTVTANNTTDILVYKTSPQ